MANELLKQQTERRTAARRQLFRRRRRRRKILVCQIRGGVNLRPAAKYDYILTWDVLQTRRQLARWIFHIQKKTWATGELIAQLKRAFRRRWRGRKTRK